jgi:hypothetical protein
MAKGPRLTPPNTGLLDSCSSNFRISASKRPRTNADVSPTSIDQNSPVRLSFFSLFHFENELVVLTLAQHLLSKSHDVPKRFSYTLSQALEPECRAFLLLSLQEDGSIAHKMSENIQPSMSQYMRGIVNVFKNVCRDTNLHKSNGIITQSSGPAAAHKY